MDERRSQAPEVSTAHAPAGEFTARFYGDEVTLRIVNGRLEAENVYSRTGYDQSLFIRLAADRQSVRIVGLARAGAEDPVAGGAQ